MSKTQWPHGDWDSTDPIYIKDVQKKLDEEFVEEFYEKNVKEQFEPEEPNRDCTHVHMECEACEDCSPLEPKWADGTPVRPLSHSEAMNMLEKTEPPAGRAYTDYKDIDAFLDECLETMRSKGHDYREGSKDLTINFKKTGADVGIDPMTVWYIFAQKHWSAIKTYIKEGGQSESEPIEGRIQDIIVYSLLLYRLVQEHKQAKLNEKYVEHGIIS